MIPPLLVELIDLLTARQMDEDERKEIIGQVERAPEEYEWADSESDRYAFSLNIELHRYSASGDKIDEVFEQIGEMMGPDLPAPPAKLRTCLQYFEWADPFLANWNKEGGYEVVELDDHSGDNMNLYIVHRRDVARVLELGSILKISLRRSLEWWREIESNARRSPDYQAPNE